MRNIFKKIKNIGNIKNLKRIPEKGWIGGVCAGVAYSLKAPLWIVRLIWAFLLISPGHAILPYILLWIFIPKLDNVPDDFEKVTE